MSFIDKLDRARAVLERQGRLSVRALGRELEVEGDELEELIEELVDVQQLASREGKVLVWVGGPTAPAPEGRSESGSREPADARKVVTIVFADLIGSTTLHEQLDAESVTRLMDRYYRAMRGAIEAHGGTVVKLMGDGVMAAFGVPRVAEDDAIRAVRAGMAMQEACRSLARQEFAAVGDIGLRVGINTGEVVVAADNTDVVGDPVNVAARLQSEAHEGQVVIGESTRRLVAARVTLTPLGSFALKGRAEAMKAYRVESLDPAMATSATAFVGRDDELARLLAVYDAAVGVPASRLAVLLGSPGLGKSRLIDEVTHRLGDAASIVTAHCDAAGGATFVPVAAALREFFQVEAGASPHAVQATIEAAIPVADGERSRIAGGVAALLTGSVGSPEETFFVIRRLLAGLAAAKPVVLVIDDLHWAEPLLLDLIDHLVQWGSGTQLFVLVGARPELRDLRSSLVTPGGLVTDVVTLAGLDAGAAMRLAANVIGAADLPAAVAAKVLATSEGNPLFVGELVRMLVDEGAIERQGDRWIGGANLAALEMPPTIHALLAARIERLGPDDRAVLERAAVVGRHFSRSAVAALVGRNGTALNARLEALQRSELIERDTGWFLGEPMLRFHHVLIRDAAYRRLLKGTRAELHEQLADWIEAQVGDAPEHDETIGWHLEQAHQLRRELGPLDAKGVTLGERAAARLAAAGRRALARDDLPVASGLLGRALDRLASDDPARAGLALDWCEALLAGGDVAMAESALAELGRFAGNGAPRLAAWHTCFTGQHTVLTAPESLHTTADAVASAAIELASLGDVAGEAKAHFVHALALARLGRIGACEAALDQALGAARRADDRRRANTVLAIAPLAALWGPSPVTRASGRCLDVVRVLRITQGAPAVESVALSCQAVLEALRGRTEAARRMLASARKMVEDLGITHRLLEADAFGGLIDLLEGKAATAEQSLRRAYDGLRDLGLGIDAARSAALLARALLAQGRSAEAEALSHESERLAGDDLKAAIAWRGVRAEALAQRGEPAAAVELAQAAVAIAAATDALLDHADARLALAAALRAAGRGPDADAEQGRAIELWEAKGATVLVERTRQTNAPAAAATPAAHTTPPSTSRHRVTPNRATAALVHLNAVMAAADFAAFREQMSETYEEIDHPTGVSYGRDANVAALQHLMRSREASCRQEPLATLGDGLVLSWRRVHASATGGGRFDVGEYEHEAYAVAELDDCGRWCRHEVFAADHLLEAVACLYERHAALLPEGPERERARATARSVAGWNGPLDLERVAATTSPLIELVDHRSLHLWSARGVDEYLGQWRHQFELGTQHVRTDEVLAVEPDALLVRHTYFGIARESGGEFANPVLELFVFGAGGLITRVEVWEPAQVAEALGRFDEVVAGKQPQRIVHRRVRPNAATAWWARFDAALAVCDFDAVAAGTHEEHQAIDHPTGSEYGRDAIIGSLERLFRSRDPYYEFEHLATLGKRLVLTRRRSGASGDTRGRYDVGPYETEAITLSEVDGQGLLCREEIFAADRLGAALVRLYERHAELLPEGPARTRAVATAASFAVSQRPYADPERLALAIAPDFESVDHRHLSSWSLRGADAYLAHLRALRQVADGIEFQQLDLLAANPSAQLMRVLHTGTDRAGGGTYERPFLRLFVAGADGRIAHAEWFDDDREAEALARFDELTGASPAEASPFDNAAARTDRALFERFNARDWPGIEALAAPDLVFDERRRMLHNTCGRDVWLEQFRVLYDVPASRFTTKLLGTRGERLSLSLHQFAGEVAGGGGPLEMDDHLVLHEVDGEGRLVAIVLFDLEDEHAAWAEIDARYHAGEATTHPRAQAARIEHSRTWQERDWEALAAGMAPDLLCHDHRVLGWGTLGSAAYARTQEVLFELAPDTLAQTRHLVIAEKGHLMSVLLSGTRDGGRFELPFLRVDEVDTDGRICRIDWFDADRVDLARARFAEIAARDGARASARGSSPSGAALPIPPTAAMAAMARLVDAQDWAAVRADCAPGFTWEDRRPIVGLSGDVELMIASARERIASGARLERREIIGAAGDRIVIARVLWAGGPADGRFEVELLAVFEVDADGRHTAMLFFDPDDPRAAQREAWARWAAIDSTVAALTAVLNETIDAMNAHDLDRLRAVYPEDLVVDDHRWTGVGRIEGREAYLRSVMPLWEELAPETRFDAGWFWLAIAPYGGACTGRRSGRLPSGGEFESEFLLVFALECGRMTRFEMFEMDAAEAALARFAELGAASPDRGGTG